jgi:hypothetical protein
VLRRLERDPDPEASMTPRSILGLVALLAFLLALAVPAHASKQQQSMMQDDRVLLNYGSIVQTRGLNEMQTLGVDIVHADISWSTLAPKPTSKKPPKGVNLTNPKSYRASRWAILDSLVRGVHARGMRLLLTPSTPGPTWATGKSCTKSERKAAPIRGSCRPDAKLYGKFITALAKRYSGTYVDPREPHSLPLPEVDLWSFVNEPNLKSWLFPSSIQRGKRFIPISARLYRGLLVAGGSALRKVPGHKRDNILLGDTGPIGGGRSAIPPIPFFQAVFCIDSRGKRLKGSAAKLLGCPKRLKRLPVDGVAHHTYTRATVGSLTANPGKGNITIGNISRLTRVLKQGVHVGAISAGASSRIQLTEFGVSSRPPAKPRKYGVALSKQAEMINLAEYLGYVNKSVRSVTQYQLEDDNLAAGSHRGHLVFQTGLRYQATASQLRRGKLGSAKPSRAAYRVPILVVARGSKYVIWGGVRGVESGSAALLNSGKFVKAVTLRNGYFSTTVRKRKGTWQVRYGPIKSRVAKPTKLR